MSVVAPTIRARLVSKSSSYSLPDSTYLIPVDWRRFHLSELINKLVSSSSPVPFDFVLSATDELLTGTIQEYLTKNALGSEETINIEFLPSLLPPEQKNEWQFQDWISDISCGKDGWILSSNYGGEVALQNSILNQQQKTAIKVNKSILSTCWIGNPNVNEAKLVAGGIDCQVTIYKTDATCTSLLQTHSSTHTHHITSLRSSATQIVAGDSVGHLLIYSVSSDPSSSVTIPPTKKRRTAMSTSGVSTLATLEPIAKWKSGSSRISRAIFDTRDEGFVYSAGWDWSIRGFEPETRSELFIRRWNQVILDLDQVPKTSILLSAGFEGPIAVWDIRSAATTPNLTLSSSSPTSTVRARPNSTTLFLTTSYDGKLRVWDLRSNKQSLFTIATTSPGKHGKSKLLTADWSTDGNTIATGGEECILQSWEISSSLPTET